MEGKRGFQVYCVRDWGRTEAGIDLIGSDGWGDRCAGCAACSASSSATAMLALVLDAERKTFQPERASQRQGQRSAGSLARVNFPTRRTETDSLEEEAAMGERNNRVGEGRCRDKDGRTADIGWPEADLDLFDGLMCRVTLHERHDGEEHGQLQKATT